MKHFEVNNFQDAGFSQRIADERLQKAVAVFGELMVKKVIGLALYWLGAKRTWLAGMIGMPLESMRTFVRVVHRDGLVALEDRRCRSSAFLPVKELTAEMGSVGFSRQADEVIVDCQGITAKLGIPSGNKLQLRTVVLTLSAAGLVDLDCAAEILGVSRSHAGVLLKKLMEDDSMALADQRVGQKKDYLVDEQAKGELLVQWALNATTGQSTSSTAIAQDLHARCEIEISDRTVRTHLKRMGVSGLGLKLRDLVSKVKKGS